MFRSPQKNIAHLKEHIATHANFPKPGILFQDLNPLYRNPKLLRILLKECLAAIKSMGQFDYVAGIESRGFILASSLADKLKAGFVPVRKKGKLPGRISAIEYQLEYGNDTIEIQHVEDLKDARVLIIDDVLATGGTLRASIELLQKYTPHLSAFVLMDIRIGGRDKIKIPLKHLF